MKKVLVIGASGSLGKGVVNELKKHYKVTGTYNNNKINIENAEMVQVDIRNAKTLNNLSDDFDTVILIAGVMPAKMKGYNHQLYIDVNITGTLNVLEFCRKKNIKKIIYIMTFSDKAGQFYSGIPIKDDGENTLNYRGDHAVYSISKVTACELMEHYHQEYGLQTIIFRIPTVYCNDDNFYYYVNGVKRTKAYIKMIQSIVNNKKIEIWGNPKNAKDMPYIKDFAVLIKKAVESKTAQGFYNAGTGNPVSLEVLVNTLIEVFGEGEEVEKIYKSKKPSQPNFTFDMIKTMQEFDYKIKYGVREMFEDIKDTLGIEIFKR